MANDWSIGTPTCRRRWPTTIIETATGTMIIGITNIMVIGTVNVVIGDTITTHMSLYVSAR